MRLEQTSGNRRGRGWLRRLLYLVYLLVLAELSARGYWATRFQTPFFRMDELAMHRFYPEVVRSGVMTAEIRRDDAYLDVLILGGSVVSPQLGTIDKQLQDRLEQLSGRPVRVFNCANVALNSYDSRWKYERMDGQEFDLVLLYESINESRLNCCPPEMFREDYGHMSWYRRIGALDHHPELPFAVLPYSIEHLMIGALDEPRIGWYLPPHRPDLYGWDKLYGADIKTTRPYRANVSRIVELARQRKATVCLVGYSYHIPDEPTLLRYQEQGTWRTAYRVETFWGTPEGVSLTIEANNAVLREVAAENAHVIHFDQLGAIPETNEMFVDPCHLSPRGCERFVANLVPSLAQWCQTLRPLRPQTLASGKTP